ncbi:MAG: hypothetical protein M1820_005271 [Bogoriella megaspora]|nr:MAG: hypothetical protein M1820_005271 [Bogoriella megaspora]
MLPTYPTIVEKLRGSGSFVDLGCCFGEEMRWLAADGAPTERMIGIDLKEQFWEFGFDLFRDTNSMNAKFLKGDIFDSNDEHLNALQGQADVVFAGNFFHLFSREGQLEAMERTVSWSRGPGSVICGLHIGATEARALTSDWKRGPGKSEQYYHNAESWRQFWNEIEERTGTKWNVQVWAQRMVDISQKHSWMGERATRFRFHCTREM